MKSYNNIVSKLILSRQAVLDIVISTLKKRENVLITYLNQHCFNIYFTDQKYRKLIETKFVIYAADAGINFALRWFWAIKYKQFNGTDLIEQLLSFLIQKKLRFYILGGNFSESEIKNSFGIGVNFVGYQTGYTSKLDIAKIKDANPDIIFIGMGVPKQEFVADQLYSELDNTIIICVGNFFEFYLGKEKRIPTVFRNKGLEWFYRLLQDPKRLWKRYVLGIPLFFYRLMKYKFLLIRSK